MKKYIISVGAALLPLIASAQIAVNNLQGIQATLAQILGYVFPILLTLAVVVVVWGIFKFIVNAGDEEARKTGRSFILWGIVGIFLMLSVWGLINILVNSFAFNTTPATSPNIVPA
jgi:hypothetical protein